MNSGDSRKKIMGRPGGLGVCSLRKIYTLETCLDQFEGIFKHKHITESVNQPNDVEDRQICSYNCGQNCT